MGDWRVCSSLVKWIFRWCHTSANRALIEHNLGHFWTVWLIVKLYKLSFKHNWQVGHKICTTEVLLAHRNPLVAVGKSFTEMKPHGWNIRPVSGSQPLPSPQLHGRPAVPCQTAFAVQLRPSSRGLPKGINSWCSRPPIRHHNPKEMKVHQKLKCSEKLKRQNETQVVFLV